MRINTFVMNRVFPEGRRSRRIETPETIRLNKIKHDAIDVLDKKEEARILDESTKEVWE